MDIFSHPVRSLEEWRCCNYLSNGPSLIFEKWQWQLPLISEVRAERIENDQELHHLYLSLYIGKGKVLAGIPFLRFPSRFHRPESHIIWLLLAAREVWEWSIGFFAFIAGSREEGFADGRHPIAWPMVISLLLFCFVTSYAFCYIYYSYNLLTQSWYKLSPQLCYILFQSRS